MLNDINIPPLVISIRSKLPVCDIVVGDLHGEGLGDLIRGEEEMDAPGGNQAATVDSEAHRAVADGEPLGVLPVVHGELCSGSIGDNGWAVQRIIDISRVELHLANSENALPREPLKGCAHDDPDSSASSRAKKHHGGDVVEVVKKAPSENETEPRELLAPGRDVSRGVLPPQHRHVHRDGAVQADLQDCCRRHHFDPHRRTPPRRVVSIYSKWWSMKMHIPIGS
mmetsp:Transcript_73799/g.159734  ORF Transcript_73799/g.159734 Transcript_73799/m.159734 type:complete len:225 (+) Transcript_73799:2979-3653(+)